MLFTIAASRPFGETARRKGFSHARSLSNWRGPIPMKVTGRSFTLDDVDATDEPLPDIDDIATSKPHTEEDEEEKK